MSLAGLASLLDAIETRMIREGYSKESAADFRRAALRHTALKLPMVSADERHRIADMATKKRS